MSDQIDLKRMLPSKETPWIEWHGWTSDSTLGWLEQLYRRATYVQVGDVREGERRYDSPQAAQAALQRAVQKKLKEGYVYEGEPPAPPPEPPSRPWKKAVAPRWLSRVDAKELARVRKAITAAKLDHRRADIETLLRPAIRFALKPVKTVKGVMTRFGGAPDLPPGFKWPTSDGQPLAFLAQIRLDELTRLDLEKKLPARGLLSVFAHLDYRRDGYGQQAKVFHFTDLTKLARIEPPHDAEADGRPGGQATARASLKLTLPSPDERIAQTLKLSDDERSQYHDGVWLAVCAGRDEPSQPGAHQLLGWADAMTEHGYTKGWELLLQVDSDDRFGFEIGDVETLRIYAKSPKELTRVRAALTAE